eukprot:347038-Prorocentrum_minimum.AAC.2
MNERNTKGLRGFSFRDPFCNRSPEGGSKGRGGGGARLTRFSTGSMNVSKERRRLSKTQPLKATGRSLFQTFSSWIHRRGERAP